MKRLLIIAVFMLTTAGICPADYDYYSKRDPQNCDEVKAWGQELKEELSRIQKGYDQLIKQKQKAGDNSPLFYQEQALDNQRSMCNDEHRAWQEAVKKLCK